MSFCLTFLLLNLLFKYIYMFRLRL